MNSDTNSWNQFNSFCNFEGSDGTAEEHEKLFKSHDLLCKKVGLNKSEITSKTTDEQEP